MAENSLTATAPLLELRQLSFAYNESKTTLKAIDLKLYPQEKLVLLGHNGAGKSTLFLNANAVLRASSGELWLREQKITYQRDSLRQLRQEVALVFQDPEQQFIAPSVEAELSFGPLNLGLSKSECQERISEVLALLGLEALRQRSPQSLSGGEKKLVSIASVLTMRPSLILFDEPTAGLDPRNTRRFEHCLSLLAAQGLGLVIATHDLPFAERWAERVILLDQGRIVADRSAQEIFGERSLLRQLELI